MKSQTSSSASRGTSSSGRPPEFIRTAKALLLRQRTSEAINLLRRGLNLDPSSDEAALLLGKCLIAAKRLDEARGVLERLLERSELLDGFVLLIRVHLVRKDPDLAMQMIQRAALVFPDERRLCELEDKATLELEDALDASTDRDASGPRRAVELEGDADRDEPGHGGASLDTASVDPEDLPTEQVPGPPADTVQVPSTGLVKPPQADKLLTSPHYRTAPGGVLEDRRIELTPTPLPADDLGFDRPGAPNLISAVKQFIEPGIDHGREVKRSLFQRLLGDGPPLPDRERAKKPRRGRPGGTSAPRVELRVLGPESDPVPVTSRPNLADDPDEVGGPTPADTPGAKQRQGRVAGPRAAPGSATHEGSPAPASLTSLTSLELQMAQASLQAAGRGDPTRPLRQRSATPAETVGRSKGPTNSRLVRLRDPLGQAQSHRIDDSRGVLSVGGELVSLSPPPLQPTMPSHRGPRIVVSPQRGDADPLTRPRGRASRRLATKTDPMHVIPERRSLSRWWPLWLTLCLLAVASGTIAGLMVRQHGRVARNLEEARRLARSHDVGDLRQALSKVRRAADLGGRQAEVVAIAAALHAELALVYGASDLKVVDALREEGTRLGAEALPRAGQDMALASAYVGLARKPLPEAIGHLLKLAERHPQLTTLRVLYADALTNNGELSLAGQVLEALPAEDPQVFEARARLHFRLGEVDQARRLLRSGLDYGLSPRSVELELCRYAVETQQADVATMKRLRSITEAALLPPRQLAWAHLLIAMIHLRTGQSYSASESLDAALTRRPTADAEFSYRASQLLLASQRFDEAQREAGLSSRLSPREPRFRAQLAAVDLAKDRPRAVITRLAELSDLEPGTQLILAEAYLNSGDLARAQSTLQRLPSSPFQPHKRLVWARLHLAAGRPYQALRELSGLEGQLPVDRSGVAVVRGLVALSLSDLTTAARWMRTALKQQPMNAEALWALAVVARKQTDPRLATQYLRRSVVVHPYFRRSRLELGDLELRLGNFESARTQFERVLALDATSFEALVGVARATVELGSPEAGTYLKALRVAGHLELAERLAVRDLVLRGKWDEAIKAIRQLLRRRKLQGRDEVELWLAEAARAHGDPDRAEKLYNKLLLGRGSSAAAHLGLSELFLERNRLGPALRHGLAASEALTVGIYPLALRARAGIQLARCYRQGDALGAAIAELQDVLELQGANFAANLELGQIYASLNKRDRAVHHLARALKTQPKSAAARGELGRVCQDLATPPADCQL